MAAPGGRWRLIAATVAFLLWAPLVLVGLPLAVLLLLGRAAPAADGRTAARSSVAIALGVAALSAATVPLLPGGLVGSVYAAVSVLLAAALAVLALLGPAPFWTLALRSTAAALVSLAVLARAFWGRDWLASLQWEATRQAQEGARAFIWVLPDLRPGFDAVASFIGTTLPATLALQCLAALALAWTLHGRLALHPVGAPLRPFREFRMGDAWVWVLVGTLAVWLLGRAALAQNLAVLVGTLYFLQGAAVAGALASALGISTVALVVISILAAPFAAILIPGLCTLGVTDTWLQYRRRIAARADRPHQ